MNLSVNLLRAERGREKVCRAREMGGDGVIDPVFSIFYITVIKVFVLNEVSFEIQLVPEVRLLAHEVNGSIQFFVYCQTEGLQIFAGCWLHVACSFLICGLLNMPASFSKSPAIRTL